MVKKTTIVLLICTSICFGQTTEKYGTGDCNGTGCDWSDIATGEAAITETGVYTFSLYDDGDFTISSKIIINDPDPSEIIMTPAEGEIDGTEGSGVLITMSADFYIFEFAGAQTTIEGIEFSNTKSNGGCFRVTTGGTCIIKRSIIRVSGTPSQTVYMASASAVFTAMNCFFYGTPGYHIEPRGTVSLYNCTFANATTTNVNGASGTFIAKNCLSMNSGTSDYASVTLTTCGSSDATGSVGLQNLVAANQVNNATAGSEDLFLKAGADAIDAGTDLGTTPSGVEVSIGGRDRNAQGDTWDIGADEYVAAAGSPTPTTKPKFILPTNWGQIEKIEPRGLIVSEMYASN